MKKTLIAIAFLFAFVATSFAQSATSYIGLQIPPTGSNNWYIPLNYNFNKLDQILGGQIAIPSLHITNSLIIDGSITANNFVGQNSSTLATVTATTQGAVSYFAAPGAGTTIGGVLLHGIPFYAPNVMPRLAAANDIGALWTDGSCVTNPFLKKDGTCGAGGGMPVLPARYFVIGASSGSATAAHMDDGGTVAGTITMTEPLAINDGSSTGGGFGAAEGNSVAAGASTENLWADATSHRWKFNANSGSDTYFVGTGAPATAGNCAKFAANGIDVADTGSPCGSGGVTGLTTHYFVIGMSATSTGSAHMDDGGTTTGVITMTEPLSIADGSSTGGGFGATEGTNVLAAANTENQWADVTSHRWKFNANNSADLYFVGTHTPATSGNCAKFDSNGIDVVDTGSPCGSAAVPGASQQVLYNGGGTLAASSGFTFDGSSLQVSGVKAGYSGNAQIASGGSGGYSNFTLNGNNSDGSRIGFIGGGAADPNLYLDALAGGGFHFRANNADIGIMTATGLQVTSLTCTGTPCGSGGASIPGTAGQLLASAGGGTAQANSIATIGSDGTIYTNSFFGNSNTGASYYWQNNAAATNAKRWSAMNYDSSLHLRADADDESSATDWLRVDRSGTTPTQALFGESVQANGNVTASNGTVTQSLQDFTPGFNLGADVGLGGSWYGQTAYGSSYISLSQGMHNGFGSSDFECRGGGDCNPFGMYSYWEGAATVPADEGLTVGRLSGFLGRADFKATVTSGGANATQLNFSAIGGSAGVGRPLIDTTDDVLNLTLSGCSPVTGPVGTATVDSGYVLCTTSTSVPVSAQISLAQAVTVSTDKTFPQTSVTFNVNTPVLLSVGDLVMVGGAYPESTRLTAVGTLSGGVQSITAPLRYSHFTQTVAFANPGGVGMAGRFLEYPSVTAMETKGAKITYIVLGSPDSTHIAFFTPATGNMDKMFAGDGVVNIYHGGFLTDVRDVTGGPNVDNNFHFAMMDNDAAWTNGAGIEVTQQVNQTFKGLAMTLDTYNPLGRGHFIDAECDPGSYACGNSWAVGNTGFALIRNANDLSFYQGYGGSATLGRLFDVEGPWGSFAYFSDAPTQPIFEFQHSDHDVIFAQNDDADGIIAYRHGSGWELDSSNIVLQGTGGSHTNVTVKGTTTSTTFVTGDTGPADGSACAAVDAGWSFYKDGHAGYCDGALYHQKF